ATPSGGRVCINCHQENGSVIASVSDNGAGIPAAMVARIFDPFVTTKEAGTGLGLYAVSRRVREFGGQIRCAGAPECCTTLTVRFSCTEWCAKARARRAETLVLRPGARLQSDAVPMPTLRILIADDEKAARHGMSRALAHAGYELSEAGDGVEALAAIRGT